MNNKQQFRIAAAVLAAIVILGASVRSEDAATAATDPAAVATATAAQPAQPQQQTISPAEAFTLMAGEAEKGNGAAMLTLGTMYERGIGTPRNFTKALEWYKKAAAAGMAEGYYNVGVGYEIGMGTAGSESEAFTNFEKSAEMGLPQGLYKLAQLYFAGSGVAKNETWGVELLNRSANAGHMGAANDLGVIHYEGTFGQAKDQTKAYDMFLKASEMGNAEAMKNVAVFFRDGIGRPAEPARELFWYNLSRRAGFPAGALDPAIEKVKATLSEDQVRTVDADVEAWIADFQRRQQAAAQPQQPGTAPAAAQPAQ